MIGIYAIFRKSDDKCMYVGQSKDINGRIKSHLNGNTHLSFNKDEYYGDVIEEHFINDKAFRLEREAYWIKELNPKLNKIKDETKRGEYINLKGENNPMFGKHHYEESKEKNRQAHLGKPAWNRGISPSEETKKKISEHTDNKGEKNPMFGKHHSKESRKKISQHTDTRGEKNGMFDKHHSKESKEKMKQSRLGFKWINNSEITKQVKQDDLDKYIRDGWKLGRLAWKRNL